MPRNGDLVRKRLQLAALELFREYGYDATTAAHIAARAGVTERTFFRHFADKREALFDGESAFGEALSETIRMSPPELGAWDTLLRACLAVRQMFIDNRPFTEPRQRMIAGHPALQERATAKGRAVVAAVTGALGDRGLGPAQAHLAAQMGMAALSYAVAAWFADGTLDLGEQIRAAFDEVRDISASRTPTSS